MAAAAVGCGCSAVVSGPLSPGIKEEASRRSELPSKRRPDEPTPFMSLGCKGPCPLHALGEWTSFVDFWRSYMAALREVQGQLAKEVVQSLPEKPPGAQRAVAADRPRRSLSRRHGTRALDEFRTLKDACDRQLKGQWQTKALRPSARPPMALPTSTTSSLATSRSLPALPKTRGLQGGLQDLAWASSSAL